MTDIAAGCTALLAGASLLLAASLTACGPGGPEPGVDHALDDDGLPAWS